MPTFGRTFSASLYICSPKPRIMPIRIYDIAMKLGIESKTVLAKAKELGISGASRPSSSLDKITGEYLEVQLDLGLSSSFHRGFRVMGLGNFKTFADAQSIIIRPLTLFFGSI